MTHGRKPYHHGSNLGFPFNYSDPMTYKISPFHDSKPRLVLTSRKPGNEDCS